MCVPHASTLQLREEQVSSMIKRYVVTEALLRNVKKYFPLVSPKGSSFIDALIFLMFHRAEQVLAFQPFTPSPFRNHQTPKVN